MVCRFWIFNGFQIAMLQISLKASSLNCASNYAQGIRRNLTLEWLYIIKNTSFCFHKKLLCLVLPRLNLLFRNGKVKLRIRRSDIQKNDKLVLLKQLRNCVSKYVIIVCKECEKRGFEGCYEQKNLWLNWFWNDWSLKFWPFL